MTLLRFALCMTAAALAGCGTSKEARELAIETAAAVQSLDVAISANAAASAKAAASADARIGNLIRSTAEQQSDLRTRMEADSGAKSVFERMRDFADKQEADRQKALAEASAQAQALAAAREKAKSPSAALKEVSDKLTALGREESAWERIKSTANFVRDVAKRVKDDGKAAGEAADQASTAAAANSKKP